MSDKYAKQKKGFGQNPASRRRHLSLARAAIGKKAKSGHEAGEAAQSSTSRSTTRPELTLSAEPTVAVSYLVFF